jgi:acyl-[acyl-carrier-protein]-phospholipid O-acyltransferase/long-chain-fatty-acid--[acyl-carrier-protein] ligase
MVPHILIEEAIEGILHESDGSDSEKEGVSVAVSAVHDERKGERLIILHSGLSQPPDEICKALHKKGLPNLWIPSPTDFHQVETIPLLGTGKLDLRAVKELAEKVAEK